MKTEWDYTTLAEAYVKRPDYARSAVGALLKVCGLEQGRPVCDVGAGVAHLTLHLAAHGLEVSAVEPNDEMRRIGKARTATLGNVVWYEGMGEKTGRPDGAFDAVTFGSSFNVTDRTAALLESWRILKPGGWFACLWNHRVLDDPLQQEIEAIIRKAIPAYDYGTRRQDQRPILEASPFFGEVVLIEGKVVHKQSVADCIEAWRSHGTLQRQAGAQFAGIIDAIAACLGGRKQDTVEVPYLTRIWAAPVVK
jgi:ubiquinone/menaquinone biosynthesis C-methylase UbiE